MLRSCLTLLSVLCLVSVAAKPACAAEDPTNTYIQPFECRPGSKVAIRNIPGMNGFGPTNGCFIATVKPPQGASQPSAAGYRVYPTQNQEPGNFVSYRGHIKLGNDLDGIKNGRVQFTFSGIGRVTKTMDSMNPRPDGPGLVISATSTQFGGLDVSKSKLLQVVMFVQQQDKPTDLILGDYEIESTKGFYKTWSLRLVDARCEVIE